MDLIKVGYFNLYPYYMPYISDGIHADSIELLSGGYFYHIGIPITSDKISMKYYYTYLRVIDGE